MEEGGFSGIMFWDSRRFLAFTPAELGVCVGPFFTLNTRSASQDGSSVTHFHTGQLLGALLFFGPLRFAFTRAECVYAPPP